MLAFKLGSVISVLLWACYQLQNYTVQTQPIVLVLKFWSILATSSVHEHHMHALQNHSYGCLHEVLWCERQSKVAHCNLNWLTVSVSMVDLILSSTVYDIFTVVELRPHWAPIRIWCATGDMNTSYFLSFDWQFWGALSLNQPLIINVLTIDYCNNLVTDHSCDYSAYGSDPLPTVHTFKHSKHSMTNGPIGNWQSRSWPLSLLWQYSA